MKRILFISNDLGREDSGGKTVSKRNLELLKIIEDVTVDVITFGNSNNENYYRNFKTSYSKTELLLKNLCMYAGSLNKCIEEEIVKIFKKNNYNILFLDCSLFGRLGKKIKRINSEVKIITFFHNVEILYYKERMKLEGYKYIPLVLSSFFNEKLACKYSGKRISINTRDKNILEKMYKTKIDDQLPVSFEDKFNIKNIKEILEEEIKLLFVGSYFFANVEGIKWFSEMVMPYINAKLYIVGKGMEILKNELERENVEVIGGVEDLSQYYYDSNFVVAPIFSGSGMKVKTAEALMYGKTIFGTKEAFEGYDIDIGKMGEICNSKEEFIEKINEYINSKKINKFNEFSRNYYLKNHSNDILIEKIKRIIQELS